MSQASSVFRFFGIGCGGLIVLSIAAGIIVSIVGGGNNTGGNPGSKQVNHRGIEAEIAGVLQAGFNQNKQKIFDSIHPTGTAKQVTIHDVTVIEWKRGQASSRLEDIVQFTVRYTLYWTGPITSDGYTKITQTFDTETQRYVGGQILATNGATYQDVGEALGFIGGLLLYDALNNK